MPIYEFRCPECGHEAEEYVPMGTDSWPCPVCITVVMERLQSAPGGFDLRGSGFYTNDYARKG